MTVSDSVRQAWQASAADAALPALDTVRAGADAFYRRIRLRNAVEYAACVLVVVMFSAMAAFAPMPLTARIGAGLVVAGTLLVAWNLRRLASAIPPPEAASAFPILVHQRAQLVRQRDALARVWLWYLLPMVPGLMLILFAPVFERGLATLLMMRAGTMIGIGINFLVFGGVWWLNHRAARMLQKTIDEIDLLTGDDE